MNKRQRSIVEHALKLFLEKGIRHTSVQDIIDRASISKGTFYNYFSSKNECVSALLEQIREEASITRSEMLSGKDAKDRDVLIEQITVLMKLNEKRGMSTIYEELIYSGDQELKRLVLKHRISECEWLAERLVDVYGEELRPYAFEGAVIFYGMLQQLLFTRKLIDGHLHDRRTVASSVFHYMKYIIHSLIHEDTALLTPEQLGMLKGNLEANPIQKNDVIEELRDLLAESELSDAQRDLTQALLTELERVDMREAVVAALLKPFAEAYEDTAEMRQVREISTKLWYYLRQDHERPI